VARTTRLKDKLIKLEDEVKRLKAIEKVMLAAPDQQVSFTDPDSRSMATRGRGSGWSATTCKRPSIRRTI
jgi:transposase